MCKVNCSCLCKCEKERLNTQEFTNLHGMLKESNPRTREQELSGAEQRLLELVSNRKKFDKLSQERIDTLVEIAVKKRKFIEAWKRKSGKQWGSSHI